MSRWQRLIPLPSALARALQRSGFDPPSAIQRSAAPRVFAGESVAVHAETGSGKTMAFLAPLLARCTLGLPRQVLVLVPSHPLALQMIDVVDELREAAAGADGGPLPAAELLRSAKPADRAASLASQEAEIIIATGGQLASLLPTLESAPGALSSLRTNLKAVVIDEVDAQLRIPASVAQGPSMQRRAARDAYLKKSALGRALRLVVARGRKRSLHQLMFTEGRRAHRPRYCDFSVSFGHGGGDTRSRRYGAPDMLDSAEAPVPKSSCSSFGRVQVVALTATLSHRTLRDLLAIVEREPGRLGLVVAASGGVSVGAGLPSSFMEAAYAAPALPPIEPLPPLEEMQREVSQGWRAVGCNSVGSLTRLGAQEVMAAPKTCTHDARLDFQKEDYAMTATSRAANEAATPPTAEHGQADADRASHVREGFGVRGGILRVPMPSSISHSVVLCRERDKAAAAAVILEESKLKSTSMALLVMKDGIDGEDALNEMERAGVQGARLLDDLTSLAAAVMGQSEFDHDAINTTSMASLGTCVLDSANADQIVGDAAAARARAALESLDREPAPPLPGWAVTRKGNSEGSRIVSIASVSQRARSGEIEDGARGMNTRCPAANEVERKTNRRSVSSALSRVVAAEGAKVIVAQESALRGLDLPRVDLILLTMLPDDPEAYVHIAGRTGRFGRSGHVVNIWTRREQERSGFITASLRGVKFRTKEFKPDGVEIAGAKGDELGTGRSSRAKPRASYGTYGKQSFEQWSPHLSHYQQRKQ